MRIHGVISQANEGYGDVIDLSSLDGQTFEVPFTMCYSMDRIGTATCRIEGNDIHVVIDSPHSVLRELSLPDSPYMLAASYMRHRDMGEVKLLEVSAIRKPPVGRV